jgi:tRNA(Arg) A34 adenosine deaminase TadA
LRFILNNYEKFLRRAIELAVEKSSNGKCGPFGAVVAIGDRIVGEGWNQVVSSHDPTAHAEVVAIRNACNKLGTHDLSECVLYASCEPCPMCLAATYWARIGRVIFAASREDAATAGFDDEFLYREVALPLQDRAVDFVQELHTEGAAVLTGWSDNPDKMMY